MKLKNLGTLNQSQEEVVDVDGLNHLQNTYVREINLGGKVYRVNFEFILRFTQSIEELSDADIEKALAEVSAYRFTVHSNQIELAYEIRKREWDLSLLQADLYKKVKYTLNKAKGIEQSRKSVTEKEVQSVILTTPEYRDELALIHQEISKLQKDSDFLLGLEKILSQRGEILKVMSQRRRYIKEGKGFNHGI